MNPLHTAHTKGTETVPFKLQISVQTWYNISNILLQQNYPEILDKCRVSVVTGHVNPPRAAAVILVLLSLLQSLRPMQMPFLQAIWLTLNPASNRPAPGHKPARTIVGGLV